MASLQDIKGTVSARLTYEEDFTFAKNREELAQLVRSDVAPRVSEIAGGDRAKVSIDDDGDIVVRVQDVAFIYLTRGAVTCSALNVGLSLISTSKLVASLPDVAAELHRLRSRYLKPIGYGARLYATYWYPSPPSIESLRSRYFSFSHQLSEGEITDFSSSCSYLTGPFSDTIAIETKADQVSVRVIRDTDATKFEDFERFWNAASIGDATNKVSPFFEPLQRKQSFATLGSLLGTISDK